MEREFERIIGTGRADNRGRNKRGGKVEFVQLAGTWRLGPCPVELRVPRVDEI